jgi:murein DD-endopeptidase MepM/ murein hydrolase activator NlpD
MSKWRARFAVATALFAFMGAVAPAGADTSSASADREAALQSQIGEASHSEVVALAQWQSVHDKRLSLDAALNRLDARVDAAQQRVDAAEARVAHLTATATVLDQKIASTTANVRRARLALGQSAAALYATGSAPGIAYSAVVLDGSSPNSVSAGTVYLERVSAVRQDAVAQLTGLRAAIVQLRKRAGQQRAQVDAARQTALHEQSSLEGLRAQRGKQRDAVAAQEAKEQHLVRGIRAQKAQYENELAVMQAASNQLEALLSGVQSGEQNQTGFHVLRPVPGGITSPFGWRYHPILHIWRMHTGVDLEAWTGDPVHAAASGTVVFAGWEGGYGLLVVIDHHNGYSTAYGHNSKLYVSVGENVTAGETISAVGMTGIATGPHVHFEVRHYGVPVNPVPFFFSPPPLLPGCCG